MSEPLRIALRLFGFLMLLGGLGLIVVLFVPGPSDVADWMGQNCAHGRNESGEQCTVTDVLELVFVAPFLILVGFVLSVALRPPGKGPITLDLSFLRRR